MKTYKLLIVGGKNSLTNRLAKLYNNYANVHTVYPYFTDDYIIKDRQVSVIGPYESENKEKTEFIARVINMAYEKKVDIYINGKEIINVHEFIQLSLDDRADKSNLYCISSAYKVKVIECDKRCKLKKIIDFLFKFN